jgi:predicted DNA-binding transcriptional regulator AlpA
MPMTTLTPAALLHTVGERDAATYLGYTTAALRSWRAKGKGPSYVRHGRSVRYLVADLDAWLQAHRVVVTTPVVSHAP